MSHLESRPDQTYSSGEPLRGRRRRRAPLVIPAGSEEQSERLSQLARETYPSYQFFVQAIASAFIVALGLALDSKGLLVAGAIVAPVLLPINGSLLGLLSGRLRYFFDTMAGLALTAVSVFGAGALAGWLMSGFLPRTFNEALLHGRLWWPDFPVIAIAGFVFANGFLRGRPGSRAASAVIAYELFIPISAAGFGLGSGVAGLWPQGLFVFLAAVYLLRLSAILGMLLQGVTARPGAGVALSALSVAAWTAGLLYLTGAASWLLQLANGG